ncbi:acetyl-CoA C-acyltransferase [bacterium]|nr:MAG: acetyl-CoA C-acyltransferase [bacterium]
MKNAFIVDSIRTPVGRFKGTLSAIRPDDMAAMTIAELIKRNPSLEAKNIDDVILGNANGAGEENRNVARMSALLAGLPFTVPGETVNRLCSSGAASVINASRSLKLADSNLLIAGGVESMSRAPYVISKSAEPWGNSAEMFDSSFGWRFINPKLDSVYGTEGMGNTAENLVEMYGISREDQDAFAFWSQEKAANATQKGRLSKEIMPVEIPQKRKDPIVFNIDEFIRPGTTMEALASLRPAFKKDGSVTAGNSSGLNDGACSILLANEDGLEQNQLQAKAKIISSAVVGVEPRIMGIGPVEASNQALAKAGLSFADIDIIELNEAFAAQSLACTRAWGLDDDDKRLNPNGGAIAIGHPLGMTGARLIGTATYELIEQNKEFALVTMCVGVGQGYAVVIQRV